jgi:hypothetical protein
MPQSVPKPLPDSIRRAIAQAVGNCRGKIELTIKVHCNKQMTLTLWRGSVGGVVLRLHKRAHKVFYQVVAAAKRLLANLMAALADPPPAVIAPASQPDWKAMCDALPDTPKNKGEGIHVAVYRKVAEAAAELTPRERYERNIRFNRAKVMTQVAAGLQ